MKKYLFIALALCAVISCSKENIVTEENTPLSFTAGFDEGTKSMLNNDRSQTWLGGDQVTVYDVTNKSTISTKANFTNTSTDPSTSATFTIDPEYSSFEFVTDHKYLALHNSEIVSPGSNYKVSLKYNINFAPSRKYGMPDNTIPVACFFTYSGESSLRNISFHNVTALCVVRVTNNTSYPINVSKITLQESYSGAAYAANIFKYGFVSKYGEFNYDLTGVSGGASSATITCNNSIAASGTCDYSTIMVQPNSPVTSGDITLTVKVWDEANCLSEKAILVQPGTLPYKWKAGDTKVFNISVDPS